MMKRLSISFEEIAFLGDDYVDLPILRRVGFPMAVVDAPEEIKEHALYITNSKGGHGAVMDAIEFILKLRGQWEDVISQYYA